ncbi:hypothetical protein PMAYCL1PPCAC_24850, partial [Pristionchus mayeri]
SLQMLPSGVIRFEVDKINPVFIHLKKTYFNYTLTVERFICRKAGVRKMASNGVDFLSVGLFSSDIITKLWSIDANVEFTLVCDDHENDVVKQVRFISKSNTNVFFKTQKAH